MATFNPNSPFNLPGLSADIDYATNFYYSNVSNANTTSNLTVAANGVMALVPFIPRFTHTFQTMGFYNSSAAQTGRKFRMGIYSPVNGVPVGAPLVDAGETTLGAAAGFNEKTINTQLIGGKMYWLALNTDGTLTGNAISGVSGNFPNLQHGVVSPATVTVAAATLISYGFTMASAYGALPTIGTMIDGGVATNPPVLWLKG